MDRNLTPPFIESALRCTRPVFFEDPGTGMPSVPGTGFLIKLFGRIFFITAKHVVDGYNFDVNNLRVGYHPKSKVCISFSLCNTYQSIDQDDNYHVDILVFTADDRLLEAWRFEDFPPFDLAKTGFTQIFSLNDQLFFKGVIPEQNIYNYESERFKIMFGTGNAIYRSPTPYKSTHVAMSQVSDDCPEFDGWSGSPVFTFSDQLNVKSDALFAGMLLMGSRKSAILHFMDANCIVKYLIDHFIEGLNPIEASLRIKNLFNWFRPDIGEKFKQSAFLYSDVKYNLSLRKLNQLSL